MEPTPLLEEWDVELRSADPLRTSGYAERLASLEHESVRTGRTATHAVVEGAFDVLGGSMGVVHGERVVRAFDRARDLRLPVVCTTRSGGARMQEGMVSLVQMGRVASAVRSHREAGLLSVAVLRSPTTGGVFASYASLCDVRIAEAGAVIGFAGPRIVAEATGETVAGVSHTAETAVAAGLVDAAVAPDDVDMWTRAVLGLIDRPLAVRSLPVEPPPLRAAVADPSSLPVGSAWREVVTARQLDRPSGIDVATHLCTSWVDLAHPDPTVRTALARVEDRSVVVVASDRHAGSGRPTPAGFRQAQRAIALAGRLGRPLVSLVDTPGAEVGSASENGGIAAAIAETFAAMDGVDVPTLGICVGEGGSGGALALAWTDTLLIQTHAVFSVIGPEGAAVILERDATRAPDVAGELGLTSARLLDLGIVDGVIPDDLDESVSAISRALDEVSVRRRRRRPDLASAAALSAPPD